MLNRFLLNFTPLGVKWKRAMPISGKEMLRRFLEKGWVILRQNGSHVIVGKESLRETIPVHGNKDLKNGLERKLLKTLSKK